MFARGHLPQAEQARLIWSSAGRDAANFDARTRSKARDVRFSHRLIARLDRFFVSINDASASAAASASIALTGKGRTFPPAISVFRICSLSMRATRAGACAKSGRVRATNRFGMLNLPCGNEPVKGERCQRLAHEVSASAGRGGVSRTASVPGFRRLPRQKVRRLATPVLARSGV